MITIKYFTFSPVQENTYVVYNEDKQALIIDPGCYSNAEKQTLKDFVTSAGLEVKKLINTHCHLDHVFGNKYVYQTWGVELHLHKNEEALLQFAPQSGIMWNLPFDNYTGPLHFLNEEDLLKLGKDTFRIILAPGHSPGSLCFYHEAQKVLIGGDVLFRESIGRTDLPLGNHAALVESIRSKLFILPDDVVVYPGHGPTTTIGWEKENNPFL